MLGFSSGLPHGVHNSVKTMVCATVQPTNGKYSFACAKMYHNIPKAGGRTLRSAYNVCRNGVGKDYGDHMQITGEVQMTVTRQQAEQHTRTEKERKSSVGRA